MKKFGIIVCIWGVLLSAMVGVKAKSEITYQIRYDTNTSQTYEIKNKIQEIYRDLVEGVQKESYLLMVLHNKDKFAYAPNIKVSWSRNMLIVKEGNGKGDRIKGTLSANSVCVPEVKPRSFFAELFS